MQLKKNAQCLFVIIYYYKYNNEKIIGNALQPLVKISVEQHLLQPAENMSGLCV